MIVKLLVLFFTPLLSGLLVFLVPKSKGIQYRLLLVFAGAYLFSITVVHILPELYSHTAGLELIGVFVLAGFFLQHLLEYFTSGIEHGHIHTPQHDHHGHDHSHHHKHGHERPRHHSHTHADISALVLLFALCIHAFLEGGMLAEPIGQAPIYDMKAVLLGIALHRAPAAFALMTVLAFQLHSKAKALPHLLGFSLAAPAGLLLSTYLANHEIISNTGLVYLYALVSGNFLHISTTIVFESSPDHHFSARKMAVVIVGALVAVIVEFML